MEVQCFHSVLSCLFYRSLMKWQALQPRKFKTLLAKFLSESISTRMIRRSAMEQPLCKSPNYISSSFSSLSAVAYKKILNIFIDCHVKLPMECCWVGPDQVSLEVPPIKSGRRQPMNSSSHVLAKCVWISTRKIRLVLFFFSVWNFGCRTLSQPNDCLIGDYFHGLGWRYFKSFGGTTELAHAYGHPCDFSTDRSKSNYCPRSADAMTTFLRHDQDCVMTDFQIVKEQNFSYSPGWDRFTDIQPVLQEKTIKHKELSIDRNSRNYNSNEIFYIYR